MAAPNVDPRFATDATYAADGDLWSGENTRDNPGSGRMAEGFEPDSLPATWLNYVLGILGDWVYYFIGRLGGLTGAGEWTYETVRGRVVQFMPTPMVNVNGAADRFASVTADVYPLSGAANQRNWIDLTPYLRTGCTVNGVEIIVDPGGASAMTAKLWSHVGGGAAVPTITQIGTTQSTTGTSAQALDIAVPTAIARNTTCLLLEVTSGQASDAVYMGSISFDDAGPRNF